MVRTVNKYTVKAQWTGRAWSLQCVEVPTVVGEVAGRDQFDTVKGAIAFAAAVPEDSVEISWIVKAPAAWPLPPYKSSTAYRKNQAPLGRRNPAGFVWDAGPEIP